MRGFSDGGGTGWLRAADAGFAVRCGKATFPRAADTRFNISRDKGIFFGQQLAKVAQRADARSGPSRGEAAARRWLCHRVTTHGGGPQPSGRACDELTREAALRPGAAAGCRTCVRCVIRAEACGGAHSTDAGLRARRLRPADSCAIELRHTGSTRSRAEAASSLRARSSPPPGGLQGRSDGAAQRAESAPCSAADPHEKRAQRGSPQPPPGGGLLLADARRKPLRSAAGLQGRGDSAGQRAAAAPWRRAATRGCTPQAPPLGCGLAREERWCGAAGRRRPPYSTAGLHEKRT